MRLWFVPALLAMACAGDPAAVALLPDAACPDPGAFVDRIRPSDAAPLGRYIFLARPPGGDSVCIIQQGVEDSVAMNIAMRPIAPQLVRQQAALTARIFPFRPGLEASGFATNAGNDGGGSSAQAEFRYSVLREERLTVPAGTFETVVIRYQERVQTCTVTWLTWIARDSRLPVRGEVSSTGPCVNPRAEQWVAARVGIPPPKARDT